MAVTLVAEAAGQLVKNEVSDARRETAKKLANLYFVRLDHETREREKLLANLSINWKKAVGMYDRLLKANEEVDRDAFQRAVSEGVTSFAVCREALSKLPAPAALASLFTLEAITDDIVAIITQLRDVQINSTVGKLQYTIGPIKFGALNLGEFKVSIQLHTEYGDRVVTSYRADPVDPVWAVGSNRQVPHPHIKQGVICMGNGRLPTEKALSQARILDACLVIKAVLETYDAGNPHRFVEHWFGIPQACRECGNEFVEQDGAHCTGCGNFHCRECIKPCSKCEVRQCGRCLKQCADCKKAICTSANCKQGIIYCITCAAKHKCTVCGRHFGTDYKLNEQGRCDTCANWDEKKSHVVDVVLVTKWDLEEAPEETIDDLLVRGEAILNAAREGPPEEEEEEDDDDGEEGPEEAEGGEEDDIITCRRCGRDVNVGNSHEGVCARCMAAEE